MEIFQLTLQQMLMMFTFMLVGFMLRKTKILPDNSDTTMSRLETYCFTPSLTLFNWMNNCNADTLRENAPLVLYGAAIVLIAILFAYPLSALFVRDSKKDAARAYQRNIYKYAMTFGNYGFMGNFLMLSVFGDAGFFKYSMFTFIVNLLCYTWGLLILIPKTQNDPHPVRSMLKRFLTPPILAVFLGLILGLTHASSFMPKFLSSALESASGCMGPVSMVLAGFVVGGYDFKGLLSDKKVYIATFLRLILLPAIIVTLLRLIGANKDVMTYALIAFATPLGLNTIVYPATFGGDTKTGAAMATISHTLSVITIPVMYLLFIVLW